MKAVALASSVVCFTVVLAVLPAAKSWGDRRAPADGLAPSTSASTADDQRWLSLTATTSGQSQRWQRPLREIPLRDTRDAGRYPPDLSVDLAAEPEQAWPDGRPGGPWSDSLLRWAPSELVHQPLYFDDVPLERYGQSVCPYLQPCFSAARFFGSLPVMPYKVGLDHPFEPVSTLGYYCLGTCAPPTHQSLPLDCEASVWEGGAWVGFIFLLP